MTEFIAGVDDAGRRCDRVVRRVLRNVPLAGVYAAMRRGDVRVNGRRIKGNERIHEGDKIEVRGHMAGGKTTAGAPSVSFPMIFSPALLSILFKNEHLLAVNKPAGVPTHGAGSAATQVQRLWQSAAHSPSLSFTPGPLHRLDRATSGVLTFSQSLDGAKWFSRELKAHNIQKTYLTLLEGEVTGEKHWTTYIASNEDYPAGYTSKRRQQEENASSFHTMRVTDEANGKMAITSVFPIVTLGNMTFARVVIDTGRKHQIRLQCAAHGHPIAGDTAYGGHALSEAVIAATGRLPSSREAAISGFVRNLQSPLCGIFLHAARLTLPPNNLGVPSVVDAPLPAAFCKVLDISFPNWQKCTIL